MGASAIDDHLRILLSRELEFSFSRSSGPGGQHVNKVSSKVILKFQVTQSDVLSDKQKKLIFSKIGTKITNDGFLILESQEERSQFRNKQIVTDRFFEMLNRALTPAKKRIPTKPSKASQRNRLDEKRKTGIKKDLRKSPDSP